MDLRAPIAGAADHPATATPGLAFEVLGLGDDAVDYNDAWEIQRTVHAEVVTGNRPNTVLFVEHPPVYTAGKLTAPHERPQGGTPVVDVDRGGKITWHGPGQLVGYPILRLRAPIDVVGYVRRLEDAIIGMAAEVGVRATTVEGRTGVWLPAEQPADDGDAPFRLDRKVAAIGIRVSRRVTMHGFALNCEVDLSAFDRIVPCGISDAAVTSLTAEAGRPVSVEEMVPIARRHLASVLHGIAA